MASCDKQREQCATCEYWSGHREPDNWFDSVEYMDNNKGTCYNKRSWNGNEKYPTDSCNNWQRWMVLGQ